jgi:hypothetical protein
MSNLARLSLSSLAVVLALTAVLAGSALASTRLDGNGDASVLAAPKATHKPKPGTTPVPTPRPPTPTPKPTPKPTPRPTARPAAATSAPKAKPRLKPAQSPLPSTASTTPQPAVLTTTDRRDPGVPVSVIAIGEQPLAIAVSIVALAGAVLFGAWFVLGRRRPANRDTVLLPEMATSPAPALLPPAAEAPVPRRRRDALRRRRSSDQAIAAGTPASSRAARFDEVFADSPMRRVVHADRVELLNVPHEVYGIPLTEIVSGREVELLENRDTWARVRTPWGQEGWVPAKALGT